ncbi:MAG: hypothetical protein MUC36_16840 [Planctomycetes bacterium]|jgi:hypothetical protein|nr:hypothetical protein [Planctomycetota bacterium]
MSREQLRAAKTVALADVPIQFAARIAGIEGPPFDMDSSLMPLRPRLWHVDQRPVVLERLELLLERVRDRPLPGGFWKNLAKASEYLELPDRRAFFEERFEHALLTSASRVRRRDG